MKRDSRFFAKSAWVVFGMLPVCHAVYAQGRPEGGKSIGTIATKGNLIVMTLDEGVLGKANLFNLAHHTLRFTPDGSRYRIEEIAFHWDSEFGAELAGSQATLKKLPVAPIVPARKSARCQPGAILLTSAGYGSTMARVPVRGLKVMWIGLQGGGGVRPIDARRL